MPANIWLMLPKHSILMIRSKKNGGSSGDKMTYFKAIFGRLPSLLTSKT
jgi:hypothetical protein